jgi:hypothetical protein
MVLKSIRSGVQKMLFVSYIAVIALIYNYTGYT